MWEFNEIRYSTDHLCKFIALKTYSTLVFQVTDKDVGRHESGSVNALVNIAQSFVTMNTWSCSFLVPKCRLCENHGVRNSSSCIKVQGITSDSVGSADVKSCPDICMVLTKVTFATSFSKNFVQFATSSFYFVFPFLFIICFIEHIEEFISACDIRSTKY